MCNIYVDATLLLNLFNASHSVYNTTELIYHALHEVVLASS